jgi:hypothetical protein
MIISPKVNFENIILNAHTQNFIYQLEINSYRQHASLIYIINQLPKDSKELTSDQDEFTKPLNRAGEHC